MVQNIILVSVVVLAAVVILTAVLYVVFNRRRVDPVLRAFGRGAGVVIWPGDTAEHRRAFGPQPPEKIWALADDLCRVVGQHRPVLWQPARVLREFLETIQLETLSSQAVCCRSVASLLGQLVKSPDSAREILMGLAELRGANGSKLLVDSRWGDAWQRVANLRGYWAHG